MEHSTRNGLPYSYFLGACRRIHPALFERPCVSPAKKITSVLFADFMGHQQPAFELQTT